MTTDVSYNTGNWHVCLKLKYTSTASYRPKTNISTAENWDRDSHNSLSTFRRHPRMHDKAKFSITVIWCQKKDVRNGEWDSYAQAQGQKPTLLSINRLTNSKKINRTLSKMLTKWSHWLMYMLTWYVWHHSKKQQNSKLISSSETYIVPYHCNNLLNWRLTVPADFLPSVLWRCWLGGRKGILPVKTEWWGAGMVICLERGADFHMAQLMPLPLTVSCFRKIQIGFTFVVPAHLGSPRKGPLNGCVC